MIDMGAFDYAANLMGLYLRRRGRMETSRGGHCAAGFFDLSRVPNDKYLVAVSASINRLSKPRNGISFSTIPVR